MSKGASVYHKLPQYRVVLEANPAYVRVTFNGEIIPDSEQTILVRETEHNPVVCFPRRHVRFDFLARTDHQTFCPFKGEASYWTLRVGEHAGEHAAWSYEDPFHEVAGLKGLVAFYLGSRCGCSPTVVSLPPLRRPRVRPTRGSPRRGTRSHTRRTERDEVYVQAWPDSGRPELVSMTGGHSPRWSRDGMTLYYQRDDGVYAVSVQVRPEIRLGFPAKVVGARFPDDAG